MRKATLVGTMIAAMLVFGLMLVPIAGANSDNAPALQATSTAGATTEATTGATTEATTAATTEATAEATAAATTEATAEATTAPAATTAATSGTTGATATTTPGALPRTGGDSGMGMILLGAAALFILGVAAATLLASRRGTQS